MIREYQKVSRQLKKKLTYLFYILDLATDTSGRTKFIEQ